MPHLCAEVRERCQMRFVWPKHDEAYLTEETVTLAIQINGKVRGTVTVPAGSSQDDVFAKTVAIRERCDIHAVNKIIFVQDRIMNIIV